MRQEVVRFAASRAAVQGFSPAAAIEDVCDGWDRDPEGSVRHNMGLYVRDLSDAAWRRLVRDVAKARRHG